MRSPAVLTARVFGKGAGTMTTWKVQLPKRSNAIRESRVDRMISGVNFAISVIILLLFLYPLYYIVIAGLSDPKYIWSGEIVLLPKGFHLDGYRKVFENSDLMNGYLNSILYTITATLFSLFLTVSAAYPLAQKGLMLRRFFSVLTTFTMIFSAGLVPTYLLVKDLGLLNTPWAVILTASISVTNIIITRTFFETNIPDELREAALLDGAGPFRFLFSITLPLSKAVLAVMALYYGVYHWNSYFRAMIYLLNRKMYPLQLIIREILASANALIETDGDMEEYAMLMRQAETLKYCVIVVASLPPMIAYPFVQKFFVKGIMIGAVKG